MCESLKQAIGSDMDVDVETRDSFVCTDDDGMCSEWAKKGWCARRWQPRCAAPAFGATAAARPPRLPASAG
jgi:hypothetical protein